ncbi:MAG TPA: diguanylate cyclase [Telluria sp.]|jgi:diguanylate cyclase (GGDEF)-like protein
MVPEQASPLPSERRPHWLVINNYRLRAVAFLFVFFGLAAALWQPATRVLTWTLLVLQFLVYPHVLFWRASRAPDPQHAEFQHMLLDSFLIGIWIAALGFPIWPSFTMALASSLNMTISRGMRALGVALLVLVAGMGIGVALTGFHVVPESGWFTTLIMSIGIAGYVIAIGRAAHLRNEQVRATREKLRLGEQTLHAANRSLEEKLAEIEALQAQLKVQALKDPLTGLFNRRYLDTIVPHELARCARERLPLCLMMIDIDHFKRVNDTYGHQGGDAVLQALAALLTEQVRASDVACRFGGEEFLLLLPNMAPAVALQRAEQWRASFAAMVTPSLQGPIQATLSIGIACFPDDGACLAELTACADMALYRAKAEGRNRVVQCRANAAAQPVPGPDTIVSEKSR